MIARWELSYSRKWIFSTNVYDFSVISENREISESGIFIQRIKAIKGIFFQKLFCREWHRYINNSSINGKFHIYVLCNL